MRKIFSTLFILGMVLFISCGQDHDTKSLVKHFMKEQMALDDYDVLAWSDIDSTSHVKDSMLIVMHQKAIKDKIVKKGTTYTKRSPNLNLISVRYKVGDDTLMSTFYLDDKMTGIVGVKNNVLKR